MSDKKDGTAQEFYENLRRNRIPAVLLETGGYTKNSSKFSYVGIIDESVKVPQGEKGIEFIRNFLRRQGLKKHWRAVKKRGRADKAPPFTGGFVGFISYDLGAKWQGVRASARDKKSAKDYFCPDSYFVFVSKVVVFSSLPSGLGRPDAVQLEGSPKHPGKNAAFNAAISKTEYLKKIHQIKEYLYAGETYQVNFSQRFDMDWPSIRRNKSALLAFDIYKKVTEINPSPYQFFLETPKFAIISNSPEKLFSLKPGRHANFIIETKPIKGTISRGRTAREDAMQIKKLLASKKDAAELAMIVDLERNDIGRVCKPGTVRVVQKRAVEKYSHVIHTVATIRGELESNYDFYDVLRALFPGGSVTGCPKKRTMQLISELENEPRGIYCGSAGFIGLDGQCNFNIMIRTLFLNKISKQLTFRSGGGIVVDSEAEKEYEETVIKAKALTSAVLKSV